jgi:hypothetical protein
VPFPEGSRLPEESIQIDNVASGKADTLLQQQCFLQLKSLARRQGDPPLPVQDAMPGETVFPGTGVQYPCDLPCPPGIAGTGGNLSIGCDPAAWYTQNKLFDFFGKLIRHRKYAAEKIMLPGTGNQNPAVRLSIFKRYFRNCQKVNPDSKNSAGAANHRNGNRAIRSRRTACAWGITFLFLLSTRYAISSRRYHQLIATRIHG